MRRRNHVAARTARRATGWILGVVVLTIVASIVLADWWHGNVRGVVIHVTGTSFASTEDIARLAGVSDTASLMHLNLLAIQARVQKNPFVREALVRRDPPNVLSIEIAERRPIAYLYAGGAEWFIDTEGAVFPVVRTHTTQDLPILTGALPSRLRSGEHLQDPKVLEALSVLAAARKLDERVYDLVSEVVVSPRRDIIFHTISGGVPVIVGPAANLDHKLRAFRIFWENIATKQAADNLEYIDLRYKEQVVVRWKDPSVWQSDKTTIDTTNTVLD